MLIKNQLARTRLYVLTGFITSSSEGLFLLFLVQRALCSLKALLNRFSEYFRLTTNPLIPGFSEGLRQSGVAETLWAIERDPATADAFSLNHKNATVFRGDCNVLLKQLLKVRAFNYQ